MKKMLVGVAALCLMASFAASSFAHDDKIEIKSKAISGEVPLNPNSPVWDDAKQLLVKMVPQDMVVPGLTEGTVSGMTVRSVHNSKDIAYLLEWYDPHQSDMETKMDQFSDAVAMMFPIKPGTEPSFMMGDADNPVQIIYWKAAWQKDIDKGYQDVRDAYPNYSYDSYPLVNTMVDAKGNPIVVKDGEIYKPVAPEDVAINTPIRKYTDAQMGYLPGLAVKNPRSRIDRTKPVEELNATGFGTLTTQAVETKANGKGVRGFGYWKVVLTHPLKGQTAQDASMEGNDGHFITAIAVWEGDKQNRGGRKNYSKDGWISLYLEP